MIADDDPGDAIAHERFPDLVETANCYRASGWYLEAKFMYLKAAADAPNARFEVEMLCAAWWCEERAEGRLSGLDETTS